jgi:two-component system KDP operon response regulator KdpE
MKILIADDNQFYRCALKATLVEWGYEVVAVADGQEAWDVLQSDQPPKIAILDWMMPVIDGVEVCRQLRATPRREPTYVIILTSREGKANSVTALESGADDYVTKPFGMGELDARLRLAARHWTGTHAPTASTTLQVGALVVDIERHRVTMGGALVELTPKEFDLLTYLARHPGKVLTHQMILSEVWGPGYMKDVHYLRVYVHRLRRLLGDEEGSVLLTEPGIGYALADVDGGDGP